MDSKLAQIARLFGENEQAEALLKSAKTKEEAVKLLGQFGVNVTVEEFVQIAKRLSAMNCPRTCWNLSLAVAGLGSGTA